MSKPSALFLSPVAPAPTGLGVAMRAYQNLTALSKRYAVHLFALNYTFKPLVIPPETRERCHAVVVAPVKGDMELIAKRGMYALWPQLYFLLTAQPSQWQNISRKQLRWAAAFYPANRFDLIHVFRLTMLPVFQAIVENQPKAITQLDLDDIDSVTQRAFAEVHTQAGKKRGAKLHQQDAGLFQALEQTHLPTFDRMFVCSPEDQAKLMARYQLKNTAVLPNVVSLPAASPDPPATPPFRFLFVGTLDYFPNLDAIEYFCEQVLPRLRAQTDIDFVVEVVGKIKDQKLLSQFSKYPEVQFLGYVDDLAASYQRAQAVIIPIRAGGGTRIKLLEAMAYNKAVVATGAAAAGIAVKNDMHLLLGDTPAEFAQACYQLMQDEDLRGRLGWQGLDLVREKYSEKVLEDIVCPKN